MGRGEQEGGETAKRGTNRRAGNQKGGVRKPKIAEKGWRKSKKDEKHQTNAGKPNGRPEKLRRNLKTQGWEVVVVVVEGGLISTRCR